MDPPGLVLTAYVKFPQLRECDILIGSYMRSLVKNHWDEVKSGTHDTCSMTLLVDLCQHIVNLSTNTILEAIRPITSDWHRKAPRIYSHVNSGQCFFGVDESDVLANLKNILPRCFAIAFTVVRRTQCESLNKFTPLIAREVMGRINSRVAAIMGSHVLQTLPVILECNCIFYPTLHSMIVLANCIVRCMHQENCECTPLIPTSGSAGSTLALPRYEGNGKPLRVVIEQGPCDTTYTTFNKDVLVILTEITEFWRPSEDDNEWCEDSDDWETEVDNFENGDAHWSDEDSSDSDESDQDSVRRTNRTEQQSSANTDTVVDPPEDVIVSQEAFELIDFEPDCLRYKTSQPIKMDSPDQDPPDDTTSFKSATCSKSDEDTSHRLIILLLIGFLLHTTKKARTLLQEADFNRIFKNLLGKALNEINLADIAVNTNYQTVEKIYKALFKDLHLQFGSAEMLLTAIVSQDPDVNNCIIQALMAYLTGTATTPKKNAVLRFFSSIRKVIANPFNACSSSCSN